MAAPRTPAPASYRITAEGKRFLVDATQEKSDRIPDARSAAPPPAKRRAPNC